MTASPYPACKFNSLTVLDGVWLPIPFLRFNPPRTFVEGPDNWARVQVDRASCRFRNFHQGVTGCSIISRINPASWTTACSSRSPQPHEVLKRKNGVQILEVENILPGAMLI
jgi:hypothetical protein